MQYGKMAEKYSRTVLPENIPTVQMFQSISNKLFSYFPDALYIFEAKMVKLRKRHRAPITLFLHKMV